MVPLYDEEESFAECHRRLGEVLDGLEGGPHEMVYVDDGSRDSTPLLLRRAALEDSRVVAVLLSRNFGHQAALTAALDHASGDAVVVMDGDLQDPPEAIPKFVEAFRSGHDVVYAQRERRKEALWLRLCYYLFYRIVSSMSRIRLPLDAGDFSLMSRRVVDELGRAPERHRYLRGLRAWVGFSQVGIPVARDTRYSGASKYGLSQLLGLAFDGIFSFSVVPLRAASVTGAGAVALTVLYTLYAVYVRLFLGSTPEGFTTLVAVLTFVFGVNLFFLGIIGEYVGRIYEETKARPLYVVREVVAAEDRKARPDREGHPSGAWPTSLRTDRA